MNLETEEREYTIRCVPRHSASIPLQLRNENVVHHIDEPRTQDACCCHSGLVALDHANEQTMTPMKSRGSMHILVNTLDDDST